MSDLKEILCFGDSNTYGLVPGTCKRYSYDIRWTGILADRLGRDYHIVEEGLCGRTTIFDDKDRPARNGSELLPTLLESYMPLDLVIIMLGTNDCKSYYNASATDIGDGVIKLIEQIRHFDNDTEILIISPIHLGADVWKDGYDPEFSKASVNVSKQLKSVYKDIAKRYGTDFLAASDYAVAGKADNEHMDEKGHRNLAAAIYDKIIEKYESHYVAV